MRDADVLGILLEGHRWSVPESHRPGVDAAAPRTRGATCSPARGAAALDALTVVRAWFLDRLVDASEGPEGARRRRDEARGGPPRTGRLSGRGAGCVSRSWRSVRPPKTPASDEVRRRAKQACDATETLAVVDARLVRGASAGRAEALQELLGEYQDRVVRARWAEDIAPDRPDLGFLAGEVAARCSFEQDELSGRARAARGRWHARSVLDVLRGFPNFTIVANETNAGQARTVTWEYACAIVANETIVEIKIACGVDALTGHRTAPATTLRGATATGGAPSTSKKRSSA